MIRNLKGLHVESKKAIERPSDFAEEQTEGTVLMVSVSVAAWHRRLESLRWTWLWFRRFFAALYGQAAKGFDAIRREAWQAPAPMAI